MPTTCQTEGSDSKYQVKFTLPSLKFRTSLQLFFHCCFLVGGRTGNLSLGVVCGCVKLSDISTPSSPPPFLYKKLLPDKSWDFPDTLARLAR